MERSAAHSPVRLIGVCCCCICSRGSSHSPSQAAVHTVHGLVLMVLMGVFLMLCAAEKGVSEKAAPLLLLMFELQLRV